MNTKSLDLGIDLELEVLDSYMNSDIKLIGHGHGLVKVTCT